VFVAKERLGAMQRRGVTTDSAAPSRQQAQLVPQRLQRLSPLVVVLRALAL